MEQVTRWNRSVELRSSLVTVNGQMVDQTDRQTDRKKQDRRSTRDELRKIQKKKDMGLFVNLIMALM